MLYSLSTMCLCFFFSMLLPQPTSTRPATLVPSTTLFRSPFSLVLPRVGATARQPGEHGALAPPFYDRNRWRAADRRTRGDVLVNPAPGRDLGALEIGRAHV